MQFRLCMARSSLIGSPPWTWSTSMLRVPELGLKLFLQMRLLSLLWLTIWFVRRTRQVRTWNLRVASVSGLLDRLKCWVPMLSISGLYRTCGVVRLVSCWTSVCSCMTSLLSRKGPARQLLVLVLKLVSPLR